jgi:hypothetical protein
MISIMIWANDISMDARRRFDLDEECHVLNLSEATHVVAGSAELMEVATSLELVTNRDIASSSRSRARGSSSRQIRT